MFHVKHCGEIGLLHTSVYSWPLQGIDNLGNVFTEPGAWRIKVLVRLACPRSDPILAQPFHLCIRLYIGGSNG